MASGTGSLTTSKPAGITRPVIYRYAKLPGNYPTVQLIVKVYDEMTLAGSKLDVA